MKTRPTRTSRGTAKKAIAAVPATLLLAMAVPAPAFAATELTDRAYATDFTGVSIDTSTTGDPSSWRMFGKYDAQMVEVEGDGMLRISNATTSGSFGDQLFSPKLAVAATEADTDNRFNASFVIEPTEYQEGLAVTVSPDNGQGGRNGFMRIKHVNGAMTIEILGSSFDDKGEVTWTTVPVAAGLAVDKAHTVNLQTVKVPGARNDIFRAWVGDASAVQTSTFEAYYEATGEPNYVTDTLLFRVSGTAAPATAGKGLLIDDLSLSISTEQPPAAEGEGDDAVVMPEVKPEDPKPEDPKPEDPKPEDPKPEPTPDVDEDQGEGDGVVDSEEDSDDTVGEDELAHTGGSLAAALLGATLLGAGGGLTFWSRRRA